MKRKNQTQQEKNNIFILKSIKKYGIFLFSYDFVRYKNNKCKVKLKCNKHSIVFEQIAESHLNGCAGCRQCKLENCKKYWILRPIIQIKTKSQIDKLTKIFISKSILLYGDNKFCYDYVEFINNHTLVKLTCLKHNFGFKQEAKSHLKGFKGCYFCKSEDLKKKWNNSDGRITTNVFIKRSNITHNNFYSYIKSNFINSRVKIIITCPNHGDFMQLPHAHMNGAGCRKCVSNVSVLETSWLDYIGVKNNSNCRQVNLKLNGRRYSVDGYDPASKTIYEFLGDWYHGNPSLYDKSFLNSKLNKTMGQLFSQIMDKIFRLIDLGFKVVYIWENDWKCFVKSNRSKSNKLKPKKSARQLIEQYHHKSSI